MTITPQDEPSVPEDRAPEESRRPVDGAGGPSFTVRAVLASLSSRLRGDSSGARIARGTLWSLVGSVGSRGLNLLTFLFVARWLGAERFGELGIVRSTAGMFGIFAGFGMGLTATKYVAQYRATDPERAGNVLLLTFTVAATMGALASGLLWLLAPLMATGALDASHLSGQLRIGSLLVLFGALAGVVRGGLAGLEAFGKIAACNVITAAVGLPLILAGAGFAGVAGATGGLVASALVDFVVAGVALRSRLAAHGMRWSSAGCWAERKVIWSFSLPAFLAYALTGPANWAALAILANHTGSYASVGYFAAANQWFSALVLLPMLVCGAALPVLAEQYESGRELEVRGTLRSLIRVNLAFAVPGALIVAALSPFLMGLYGPSFVEHWGTLAISALTVCLFAAQQPLGHLLAASGRMWHGLWLSGLWGSAYVLCAVCFADLQSLGVAVARLIAYVLYLALSLLLIRRIMARAKPMQGTSVRCN